MAVFYKGARFDINASLYPNCPLCHTEFKIEKGVTEQREYCPKCGFGQIRYIPQDPPPHLKDSFK